MTKYLLVTFHYEYADDALAVTGNFVIEENEYNSIMNRIKDAFNNGILTDYTFYFTEYDGIEFKTFEELEECISIKECSNLFYDEFIRLLPGGNGFYPFWDMLDKINDSINE